MKHPREQHQEEVSLSLSLSTTDSCTTSDSSAAAPPAAKRARRRRGPVVATSGEGEFVCKTCSRAFTSFQALGGHRTSHLRGRHGLELGVGAKALKQHKAAGGLGDKGDDKRHQTHECHICGLGFKLGQALGGHMRRHREEMGAAEAADAWVWRSVARLPEELEVQSAAADPPVLLELFA
ncbi:zinc finger protein ZAT12-like [Panicum miliaceum]|uniref:Zinc finger protein ZAT12-like n=1 Tax=Panicum miliaceum TaxID=4540 RepID=A0A3L6TSA2_PANMI|nr:zinc finger protein ZAT12-like [Panicum miliaceum]